MVGLKSQEMKERPLLPRISPSIHDQKSLSTMISRLETAIAPSKTAWSMGDIPSQITVTARVAKSSRVSHDAVSASGHRPLLIPITGKEMNNDQEDHRTIRHPNSC